MRNKYEYRLELDARSKAGAWGDQVPMGMPIWIMPTRYLIQKLSKIQVK